MLNDVKKEVDIMVRATLTWFVGSGSSHSSLYAFLQRILRGHPNIVYLIDAAWHKMPSGMFEVFILMEFCQGKRLFTFAHSIRSKISNTHSHRWRHYRYDE